MQIIQGNSKTHQKKKKKKNTIKNRITELLFKHRKEKNHLSILQETGVAEMLLWHHGCLTSVRGLQTGWDWSTCSLKERLRHGPGLAWGLMASGGNAGSGPKDQKKGGQLPEMFWLEYFTDFFGLWTKITPK